MAAQDGSELEEMGGPSCKVYNYISIRSVQWVRKPNIVYTFMCVCMGWILLLVAKFSLWSIDREVFQAKLLEEWCDCHVTTAARWHSGPPFPCVGARNVKCNIWAPRTLPGLIYESVFNAQHPRHGILWKSSCAFAKCSVASLAESVWVLPWQRATSLSQHGCSLYCLLLLQAKHRLLLQLPPFFFPQDIRE